MSVIGYHEVRKELGIKTAMWIYLSGSDGLPPIVLYDYQPGRGGKYAQSFLEGFTGLFQCDGYQGYSIIETAKSNNLNVFQYLYMVLLYMPDHKNESAGIEALLPWSDFIKEHCSGLIDVENITPEKHDPLPI